LFSERCRFLQMFWMFGDRRSRNVATNFAPHVPSSSRSVAVAVVPITGAVPDSVIHWHLYPAGVLEPGRSCNASQPPVAVLVSSLPACDRRSCNTLRPVACLSLLCELEDSVMRRVHYLSYSTLYLHHCLLWIGEFVRVASNQ
jgi:hypothetical protein